MNFYFSKNEDMIFFPNFASFAERNYISLLTMIAFLFVVQLVLLLCKKTKLFDSINSYQASRFMSKEKLINFINKSMENFDYTRIRNTYKELLQNSVHVTAISTFFELFFKAISTHVLPSKHLNIILLSELEYYITEMRRINAMTSIQTSNSILIAYIKLSLFKKALSFFRQMRHLTKPEVQTYRILFESTSNFCFNELYGTYCNDNLQYLNSRENDELKGIIIDQLVQREKHKEVITMFDTIKEKPSDLFSIHRYNSILNSYLFLKQYKDVLSLYRLLNQSPLTRNKLNLTTHCFLLNAYCLLKRIEDAKEIYQFVKVTYSNQMTTEVLNSIAEAFFLCDEFDLSIQVMNEGKSSKLSLDINSYVLLMKIYCLRINEQMVMKTFDEMLQKNITPNIKVYIILMNLFIAEKKIVQALCMLNDIKINKFPLNSEIYSMLINACLVNGHLDKAVKLIRESEQMNINIPPHQIKIGIDSFMSYEKKKKKHNASKRSQFALLRNDFNYIFHKYGFIRQ